MTRHKNEAALSITKKIDNITHLRPEYRKEICPASLSVKIELSRACNFKCRFCVNSTLTGDKGHMDKELYKRIVRELVGLGVKELGVFYFGESFLNQWLPEAIKYAKDSGAEYVFLTTNGSVSTHEKVKACMEAGLDSLKFSLNHADEKQFMEITGVDARFFYAIKENIKAAYKVREEGRYRCGLYASYIKYDSGQENRMTGVIEELKPYLDEVYALPLYSQAAKIRNEQWEFSAGNRGRYEKMVEPLPCWALFQEGHINFDGTLNACCFAVDNEFIMGDLTKQSFMEAWNSPKFQELRRASLNKDISGTACEHCVCKKQ